MNFDKFNKNNYKRILRHCVRTKDENGIYFERTNPDIDFSKTHLNYAIGDDINDIASFERKLEGYKEKFKVRNCTTVLLGSWVIQIPDFYEGDPKVFFEACDKILRRKYKYHIGSFVHMDETTEFYDYRQHKKSGDIVIKTGKPHMHFLFAPIIESEGQFNCKKLINKDELENMHCWMEKELEKELGYFVAIQKDETRDRHEMLEKFGKIPGMFEHDEKPEYIPMKELKRRTQLVIYDEYMKQNERIEEYKAEVEEYKRQVEAYKNQNLDALIAMNTEYIRKDEVQRIIGQFFDMLEMDLPKDRLKKYRKLAEKAGLFIDRFFSGTAR